MNETIVYQNYIKEYNALDIIIISKITIILSSLKIQDIRRFIVTFNLKKNQTLANGLL